MIVAVVAATPPTLAVVTAYYKGQKTTKQTVTTSTDILVGLERIEKWAKNHEETDRSFEQYVHLRFHDILNQLAVLRSFHNVENVVSEWRALRATSEPTGNMPGQSDRDQLEHDEDEHGDQQDSSSMEGFDV